MHFNHHCFVVVGHLGHCTLAVMVCMFNIFNVCTVYSQYMYSTSSSVVECLNIVVVCLLY